MYATVFCRQHILLAIVHINIATVNVERVIPFSSHSATKHWNFVSSPKPSSRNSTTEVSKTFIEYVLMVLNVEHYSGHQKT